MEKIEKGNRERACENCDRSAYFIVSFSNPENSMVDLQLCRSCCSVLEIVPSEYFPDWKLKNMEIRK